MQPGTHPSVRADRFAKGSINPTPANVSWNFLFVVANDARAPCAARLFLAESAVLAAVGAIALRARQARSESLPDSGFVDAHFFIPRKIIPSTSDRTPDETPSRRRPRDVFPSSRRRRQWAPGIGMEIAIDESTERTRVAATTREEATHALRSGRRRLAIPQKSMHPQ
jgi:hypothetical protein